MTRVGKTKMVEQRQAGPRATGQRRRIRWTPRRGAAVAVAVVLVGGVAQIVLGTAPAQAATYTTTTTSWVGGLACGSWASFAVPSGATSVSFRLIGGGGAAGDNVTYLFNTASGGSGGQGAVVTGTLSGVAGATVQARIGCGGTDQGGSAGAAGYIKGGYVSSTNAGGGGGASVLCLGSGGSCSGGTVLAIAGGGGGGGGASVNAGGSTRYGGDGGNAGGGTTVSRNGGTAVLGAGGQQGENSGGGGGGGGNVNPPADSSTVPPPAPSFGVGGNGATSSASGGGGGGGLIGGGGGGSGSNSCCTYNGGGGGGAAASWAKSTVVGSAAFTSSGATNQDCTTNNRNTTVTGENAGYGGTPGLPGCAGYVEVTYSLNSTGTNFTTQPSATAVAGVVFATQPVVRATNPGSPASGGVQGEPIKLTYSGTSSGDLTCAANPVTTDGTGYASFSNCFLPSAGTYTLTATNATTSAVAASTSVVVTSNNDWSGFTPSVDQSCGTARAYALPVTALRASVTAYGGGGGGGGGGAGANGGAGAAGATASLSNFTLPSVSTYSQLNYEVGCGGAQGRFDDTGSSSNAPGGAGGAGWGNGGNGGSVSGGSNRHSSGGGGGGGTSVCLGGVGQTCSVGVPVVVAGGGAGGGGSSSSGKGAAGNQGDGGTTSASWYGAGAAGTSKGGSGGARGNDAAGGGGAGGNGINGESGGSSTAGGVGGSVNANGGGGGGWNGGNRNGAAGNANSTGGGNGGNGGFGDSDSRRTGGGGGGGGYYGGGGGGGDYGSSSPGSGGGGSGSSWGTTALGASPSFSRTGGGAAGAGGGNDSNGVSGNPGSISVSLAGTAINLATPGAQTSTVGTPVSFTPTYAFSTLDGRITCCNFTAVGLPGTMSINSSTGVISGTAPTLAQTASITVTARTTANTFLVSPAQFSTSVTFSWVFTPGAATKVVLTAQPNNPSPVATNFTVGAQIQDQYNNRVTTSTDSVSIAIKSGTGNASATLTGGASVPAVGGNVSFSSLQINLTGFGYKLTVASGALTAAETSPFDVVVFATGGSITLRNQPSDPTLADSRPGSGVALIEYFYCDSGYTGACTAATPWHLAGTSAVAPDYASPWSLPAAGQYRVVSVVTDNVGNKSAVTASTPVKVG